MGGRPMRARRRFISYVLMLLKSLIQDVACVKNCASESALDATPSKGEKRIARLFHTFRPVCGRHKGKLAESPWRTPFLTECGVDFVNTPGDTTKEARDIINPNTNIQGKYTSVYAPRLRKAAEARAVLQEKRVKVRSQHKKDNPHLYDKGSYSDTGFLSDPDSDPDTNYDSDMVYGTDSCSE